MLQSRGPLCVILTTAWTTALSALPVMEVVAPANIILCVVDLFVSCASVSV